MAAPSKGKKEEPPHPVKTFLERNRSLDNWLETVKTKKTAAYLAAAQEMLTGKDGRIDHSKLQDTAYAEKFANKIWDNYKTHFKIKGGDWIDENNQMYAHIGDTKDLLVQRLREIKDAYKLDTHISTIDEHAKELAKRHQPGLIEPLLSYAKDEKGRKALLKHVGLEELVGTPGGPKTANEAVNLFVKSIMGGEAQQEKYKLMEHKYGLRKSL